LSEPAALSDPNSLSPAETADLERLEAVVDDGLDVFIAVAHALMEIRDRRLYRDTHSTFESYIAERFGFARRTGYAYIEAARVLENVQDVHSNAHLSFSHLRVLAPLAPDDQRALAGEISELTVAQARRVIREWRRQQRVSHNDVPEPPPFPAGTFRTIVVDPPWTFSQEFGDGLAGDVYRTMTLEEICALPVHEIAAPDSHLYLWVPATKVPDGIQVMEAYGFRYVALLTWVKPSGGLGRWWRYASEHIVFGVRGKLLTRPNLTNVVHAKRSGHSRKPDEFYDHIEKASPGPYVDLFARRERPAWVCWGNEIPQPME